MQSSSFGVSKHPQKNLPQSKLAKSASLRAICQGPIIRISTASVSPFPEGGGLRAKSEMWKQIKSAIVTYQHHTATAKVLEKEIAGEIYHDDLEMFRDFYGDSQADAACVGLSRLFRVDEVPTLSVEDLLYAPKPTAKQVAREDAVVICLTYLHDPKAVSGRLEDRLNPVNLGLLRAAIVETCRKHWKFHLRIWSDITNASATRKDANANWVGGGLIPYLLFEHVSVGYHPRNTSDDRLWPLVECMLASLAKGTRFVLLKRGAASSSACPYEIYDKRMGRGLREPSIHRALSQCANWALSGPIFLLPTYWKRDRQELACLFGQMLKSEHVQDMVKITSSKPKFDPIHLKVVTARDHTTVLKNCCFSRAQEIVESRASKDATKTAKYKEYIKFTRKHTIIDGPRVPHPDIGWRPDVAFLPSCFEYAPLTPAIAEQNEIRSRTSTEALIYESSQGKIYALIVNGFFWKERAAVWVSLEDTSNNFREGRVTSFFRIIASTAEQEIVAAVGLAAARIRLRTTLPGKEVQWT